MSGYGESMVMGSPVSSPTSPGAHGVQSPFLPSYLMGDPTSPTSPLQSSSRLFSGHTGPSSPPKPVFNKPAAQAPANFGSPFSSHNGTGQAAVQDNRRDLLGGRAKEKAGAPPVSGLLESTINSPAGPALPTPDRWGDASMNTTGFAQRGVNSSFAATPGHTSQLDVSQSFLQQKKVGPSPAQIDPFYTQGETIQPDDELDETWVTIFGFPPAATSFILQQFSQYGNIVKHIVATDGNWMHVHYQSKLQAKKALSKNGKVFGGTVMVGVTPCIDKVSMETGGQTLADSMMRTSTLNQSALNASLNVSLNTSMRPLTAAYKAANAEHQVKQGNNTPQKNAGLVGKAMEYVFGW